MLVISHLSTNLDTTCDRLKRGEYVCLCTNLCMCKMCGFEKRYSRPDTLFPIHSQV